MNEKNEETRPVTTGAKQVEVAVLAGGCFWGVEGLLRDVAGVIDTEAGYTGGWLENPTYEDTHHSRSGHAEAVRVTFDYEHRTRLDLGTAPRSTTRTTCASSRADTAVITCAIKQADSLVTY